MRLTKNKKEILSYFAPDNRDWVTGEIGPPPFDVVGVAWLIHGMKSHEKRHCIEFLPTVSECLRQTAKSTRRKSNKIHQL